MKQKEVSAERKIVPKVYPKPMSVPTRWIVALLLLLLLLLPWVTLAYLLQTDVNINACSFAYLRLSSLSVTLSLFTSQLISITLSMQLPTAGTVFIQCSEWILKFAILTYLWEVQKNIFGSAIWIQVFLMNKNLNSDCKDILAIIEFLYWPAVL